MENDYVRPVLYQVEIVPAKFFFVISIDQNKIKSSRCGQKFFNLLRPTVCLQKYYSWILLSISNETGGLSNINPNCFFYFIEFLQIFYRDHERAGMPDADFEIGFNFIFRQLDKIFAELIGILPI